MRWEKALNKAYDDGRLEAMREALEEVPADLEDVFNKLLSKDDPNKAETIRMLQWVLLSRRPLKPEELFFAVLAGTAPEYTGPWDRSKTTGHTIQRRITASSKGLIEARTGYTAWVQFIHLSVNDFLFRNQRLQTLDQTLQPDPISASHGQLWDRCWSDIKRVDTTPTSKQRMRQLSGNYPFLLYAASYVFDHAEKALSGRAMQEEIVRWLQMRDVWFGWWKTFLSTVDSHGEHEYSKRNMDVGLLYVLSFRGYEKLVTVNLSHRPPHLRSRMDHPPQSALHRPNRQGPHLGSRLAQDARPVRRRGRSRDGQHPAAPVPPARHRTRDPVPPASRRVHGRVARGTD